MYQDFTTYTETDPEGTITVSETRVTWAALRTRMDTSYVYKDFGANYFDGDFEFLFALRYTSSNNYQLGHFITLANDVNSLKWLYNNTKDYIGLSFYDSDSEAFKFNLSEYTSGTSYSSSKFQPSSGTTYYCKLKRDESVGTYGTLYLYIYSDSGRTTLVDTLSLALHAKKDFRYFYVTHAYGYDGTSGGTTAYLENFDLQLSTGLNMQVKIGSAWKNISSAQVKIGNNWKNVSGVQIKIGNNWKNV